MVFNERKIDLVELKLVGEVQGDVNPLVNVLKEGITFDLRLNKAYLGLIKYGSEKQMRLGLFLDTDAKKEETIDRVANFIYQNIGEMDIFYFSDLSTLFIKELKDKVKPFIVR